MRTRVLKDENFQPDELPESDLGIMVGDCIVVWWAEGDKNIHVIQNEDGTTMWFGGILKAALWAGENLSARWMVVEF